MTKRKEKKSENKEIERIIEDIKALKIQGARNVAVAAIKAFVIGANDSKAENAPEFYKEMMQLANKLSKSRPTEPMMRNSMDDAIRFILALVNEKKTQSISYIKKALDTHEEELLKRMENDAKKLAEFGAKLIPDEATVLTHCHSSTSTGVLKEAKKMGKKFKVICFETRPRFQGRITAKELLEAKIDVTLTIDGAMNLFMKKADIAIVGADSISARGDLINKIGTGTLAHMAKLNDVPFYSAAELFKYSPMTLFGEIEEIEERDSKEVWEKAPKGLKIRNPAFEVTPANYICGFITEAGVVPPQSLFALANQKLGIKI